MKNYYMVTGTYGSGKTPCFVFVAEDSRTGTRQYVVDGGTIVNETHDEIQDDVNVEELSDIDCFTWSEPINSLEDLEKAIEDE